MIEILVGTNRPGSNTRKVATQVADIYTSQLGAQVALLDLATLPAAELFSPAAYETKPEKFASFNRAIIDSEGLVIVTPEYNGSMPGVLKYFIDHWKYPESFDRRPICYIGLSAGPTGAVRPIEHLSAIFAYRNAFQYPERVFLPNINGLLDPESGKLTEPSLVARLEKQAQGFLDFLRRMKKE
jgi:chromate reductase